MMYFVIFFNSVSVGYAMLRIPVCRFFDRGILCILKFPMYIDGPYSECIPHISKQFLNIELRWKVRGRMEGSCRSNLTCGSPFKIIRSKYVKRGSRKHIGETHFEGGGRNLFPGSPT